MPQRKENAFIVRHYAGRVKYQVITLYFIYFNFSNKSWIIKIVYLYMCIYTRFNKNEFKVPNKTFLLYFTFKYVDLDFCNKLLEIFKCD